MEKSLLFSLSVITALILMLDFPPVACATEELTSDCQRQLDEANKNCFKDLEGKSKSWACCSLARSHSCIHGTVRKDCRSNLGWAAFKLVHSVKNSKHDCGDRYEWYSITCYFAFYLLWFVVAFILLLVIVALIVWFCCCRKN